MHTKQKQKVIKLSCTQSYALQKYNYGIQRASRKTGVESVRVSQLQRRFCHAVPQSCVPWYELPRSMAGTSRHAYSLHYNYRSSHNHNLELSLFCYEHEVPDAFWRSCEDQDANTLKLQDPHNIICCMIQLWFLSPPPPPPPPFVYYYFTMSLYAC